MPNPQPVPSVSVNVKSSRHDYGDRPDNKVVVHNECGGTFAMTLTGDPACNRCGATVPRNDTPDRAIWILGIPNKE